MAPTPLLCPCSPAAHLPSKTRSVDSGGFMFHTQQPHRTNSTAPFQDFTLRIPCAPAAATVAAAPHSPLVDTEPPHASAAFPSGDRVEAIAKGIDAFLTSAAKLRSQQVRACVNAYVFKSHAECLDARGLLH